MAKKPADFETFYKQAKLEGWTDTVIAEHFGVGPSAVTKWKKALNIPMSKPGRKPLEVPESFKMMYWDLKAQGLTDDDIGQRLFISVDTVSRWKRVVGIKSGVRK
jgi:transposase